LLEATWNEKGALCLIHARWAVLSPGCRGQFSRVLGQRPVSDNKGDKSDKTHKSPQPTGASGFKGGPPKESWTGTEYHCDPTQLKFLGESKNCEMDQTYMSRALHFGILADDSKLQ
jgi:hypothetical protein